MAPAPTTRGNTLFRVQADPSQLDKAVRLLGSARNLNTAYAQAINATAAEMRTAVSRAIRERVNIKKRDVDKFLHIAKAIPSRLAGGLKIKESQRIPLSYFDAREAPGPHLGRGQGKGGKGSGASYRISTQGGRRTIPHTFLQAMPIGGANAKYSASFVGPQEKKHMGIMVRDGAARLPITEKKGVSPWGVFAKGRLQRKTVEDGRAILRKKIDQAINFQLLKQKGLVGGGS